MNRLYTLLSCVLLFSCGANAQTDARVHCKATIVGADGQPIAGALVECYEGLGGRTFGTGGMSLVDSATSGAKGVVEFKVADTAMLMLVASKPGLALGWTTLIQGGVEDAGTIALTAATSVVGIVQDVAGKPVAGAEVRVKLAFLLANTDVFASSFRLFSQPGSKYLSSRTGADGRFRIEGLPAEAGLELEAAKAGLAQEQPSQTYLDPNSLRFHAGDSNIVLTLCPAGAVAGQVVQEDSGTPVAGARVFCVEPALSASKVLGVSGTDGRFEIPDLSAGSYQLRAVVGTNALAEWIGAPVSVSVDAGVTNRDVKLAVSRGGVLEVTVKAGDELVAGASVFAYGEGVSHPLLAIGPGKAQARLAPGDFQVMVSKDGFQSYQSRVSVERGQTNRLTAELESAVQVRGVVLKPDGQPAAKVTVSLFPFHRGTQQTDADGRFTLSSDSRQFGGMESFQPVVIVRDTAGNLAAAVDVEEGATNTVVQLAPGLVVTGRVVDPKGQGITNAQVQVMLRATRISTTIGSPGRTDSEGKFEVKGLPPGRSYTLNVSAKGFGQGQCQVESQEATNATVAVDPIELGVANLSLAGVVVDAEDKPVAGARVHSQTRTQPNLNTTTDKQGRFSFDQVCAGPIALWANAAGASGNANAEGGETNVTIQLGRSQALSLPRGNTRINGTVTGPDGKPAARAFVYVFPRSQGHERTDAEGRFKIAFDANRYGGMNENQRILVVSDPDRNLAAALDMELNATNASLKLEPGWTVAGRVVDSAGKSLTNATVQPMFWTDRMGSWFGDAVKVDADGRFEIKGLAVGRRYGVNVSAKGYGQDSQNVEAPGTDNRRVDLEPISLPIADQRIAGIVVGANEKPVANAWINSYGGKQPSLHAQTDSKGRFAFSNICSGPINLSANSPSGNEYGQASAAGGDTNIVVTLTSSSGVRSLAPRAISLKGKPLPDLAALGGSASDVPGGRPILALLLDAEQRPSRRALRLLTGQADTLKSKGISVVVIQAGEMADEAFEAWKKEAAVPFPVLRFKANAAKARAAWGSTALPWFVLADKTRVVKEEGFAPEELEAKLKALP